MKNQEQIVNYSIKTLFEKGDNYVIPVYQRNYAWQLGEISQLIQDIYDSCNYNPDKPYYIGTLVVFERNDDNGHHYETIDGQQRITTLTILLNAVHRWCYKENINLIQLNSKLSFYSRPKSSKTLELIGLGLDKKVSFPNSVDLNVNIKNRYLDAESLLKQFFGSPDKALSFYNYLTEKVTVLRVNVPEKTDLNHYFEIMNNRGEQLEKHEVLKAKLLAKFSDSPHKRVIFNKIWEAVADMERYVQYGFNTTERTKLFDGNDLYGNKWNRFNYKDFSEIVALFPESPTEVNELANNSSIENIITHTGSFSVNENHIEEAPERFSSVINFSGFLLHILRIQTQQDIPLDDKRLIEEFSTHIKTANDAELFVFNLLKGKHLYDQFVIKREFVNEKEDWSLKRLKWYDGNKVGYVNTINSEDGNRNLLMLLSMFHVSLPSMNYKHWLSASLNYLFAQGSKFNEINYTSYLFELAKSYFFDRILSPQNSKQKDYYDMIFKATYNERSYKEDELNWESLNKGTAVENFAFNFVDYIIWMETKTKFEFTSRSSVEHFYPQNPINGIKLEDETVLDSFGNLCLISSSKNSRLSNYMPKAKLDHYTSQKHPDSLKQNIMMEVAKDSEWDKEAILNHQDKLFNRIKQYYNAN